MLSLFSYIQTTFQSQTRSKVNFKSFGLISKLPLQPEYNFYNFMPTLHKTSEKPDNGKYFNYKIGCADDLVLHALKELHGKNYIQYKALGINERLHSAIMQASLNPVTGKAKYIVISSYGIGRKYGNPIIGVFENEHKDAEPSLRIEYQIENYS